ncbi:hypothetical protein N7468_008084 [Penicillium chermesinum]|uniref:AMP-dependent synthetase/ligase domain-containing protein n=1 Tax=Penicillium chermesinum TaxID=63820 RepID=A0A9W9NP45_9EURO|nr:uncharacterized protein N7468_008084 [Penicillium chermesinum]KAJ5223542.1 hypothetical protein N7468_008084 [Penicillium chermesinum]
MVLPSPLITPQAQMQILEKADCTVYLRPGEAAEDVGEIPKGAPHIWAITFPPLGCFLNETEASPINYPTSWAEGKNDPWLVFHSGTTGTVPMEHIASGPLE